MQKTTKKYFPIFVLPTLIAFFIAFVIPFFWGLFLSFFKFNTIDFDKIKFVGIENYEKILADDTFTNAFKFTIVFAIVAVILINIIAFSLAVLLTKKIKGTNFFRTVFFMPNLIGGVILGYVWYSIFNAILYQYGKDLTYDSTYGFWGMVILMCWQMIGYMMIIYIAGLQNVSADLKEAADIDGATWWQKLTKITIPMVMPSITICLFMSLSNCFKLFDQNLSLTAGAPERSTEMLALNIFKSFMNAKTRGVGQAKAVVFFVLVAVITITQLFFTRNKEVEQ